MSGDADKAEMFILCEADDLHAIGESYANAVKSGKHDGRTISPHLARTFAREFRNRAEALYMIAPLLRRHLRGEAVDEIL